MKEIWHITLNIAIFSILLDIMVNNVLFPSFVGDVGFNYSYVSVD